MRVTTTIERGPVATTAQARRNRRDSHTRWTKQWGPVSTSQTEASGAKAWTYDQADRLTSGPEGTTYGYNPDGNLTSIGPSNGPQTSITYNPLGELTGVTTGSNHISYARDALGRTSTRSTAAGVDTYDYDAISNNPVTFKPTAGAAVSLIRQPNGQLIAENPTGATGQRALTNPHGDLVALRSQANGNITYSAIYDPFGVPTTTGTTPAPLGFQTMATDPDTGLVDMAFRSYDPATGRFIAPDSIYPDLRAGITANRYAYGNANPLDYVDLNGHFSFGNPIGDLIDGIGSLASGVVSTIGDIGAPLVGEIKHGIHAVTQAASAGVSVIAQTLTSTSQQVQSVVSGAINASVNALTHTTSRLENSTLIRSAITQARDYASTLRSAADRVNTKDVNTALNIVGFVPGLGAAADVANAGLYLLQGDTKNALIAFAAMIPVAGSAAIIAYRARAVTRLEADLARAQVRSIEQTAAKTGDDVIRLSTKESWANLKTLDDHFARHGADFGATSADDYAGMGSEFFQRGGAQHLPTKIAPDGTIRMYDQATNTFGSFAPNGMTKTLFKPTSPDYWSRHPGVLQ